nr:hypothetical protein Iba_chr10bCG11250 [Ipomoea batatas]GMD42637.1 hypothetical protein Iba_chr10bCG11260 [Ipomoea batatas]GME16585.1 hypothetical protein Iba_scaffold17710CG0010 [Ipomoea batatas]GME19170.1 hypothetical protein Iba_scaffold22089CG0010 [Ipomoea batatas]
MRSPEKALQPTPRRSFSIAWDERDVDGSPPLFEVTTATIATGRTAANRAKSPLPLRWMAAFPSASAIRHCPSLLECWRSQLYLLWEMKR